LPPSMPRSSRWTLPRNRLPSLIGPTEPRCATARVQGMPVPDGRGRCAVPNAVHATPISA
jgi:hypothetical protein